MKRAALLSFFISVAAHAQVPLTPQAWQLQQLVNHSAAQLKATREMLEFSKQDSASMADASRMLQSLALGIGRSIQPYQGTKTYEQALLKLQAEDAGSGSEPEKNSPEAKKRRAERISNFQAQNLSANRADLENQNKLETALRTAEPGFVPKIQAQAQLGAWQTNTRLSAQLAELLAAIHGLRADLNGKESRMGSFEAILKGSELQNQKQRDVSTHGLR